jgi:hypothetical protein
MTLLDTSGMIDEADLVGPDDVLYHQYLIVGQFGNGFWDKVVTRMEQSSIYQRHTLEVFWDDCLAYLQARLCMDDPAAPLICCLFPDFAWHFFQHYNAECREFGDRLCGLFNRRPQPLHHDPAGESAATHTEEQIAPTLALFEKHGIEYHPRLWRDHLLFPNGASVIRTGIVAAPVPASRYRLSKQGWPG